MSRRRKVCSLKMIMKSEDIVQVHYICGFAVSVSVSVLHGKFYPLDFDEDERTSLRIELQHFKLVRQLPEFNTLTEIFELCRWLMRTRKSNMFPLLYKVITLIPTLPVSTATTERSFSRMNIVKNALCNKMEDDFLPDCLVVNIGKEIAKMFSTDSIIDDFRDLKTRRSLF
ncbi:hypothetical protein QQ045_028858 [Rhodiola kirilowii]